METKASPSRITVIRWIAVIPAAFLAWWIVLGIGMLAYFLLESLCPEDQQISGTCVAGWWAPIEEALFFIFGGFSAAAVVAVSAWTAPNWRRTTALVAYLVGASLAIFAAMGIEDWLPTSGALVMGFGALLFIFVFIEPPTTHSTEAEKSRPPA